MYHLMRQRAHSYESKVHAWGRGAYGVYGSNGRGKHVLRENMVNMGRDYAEGERCWAASLGVASKIHQQVTHTECHRRNMYRLHFLCRL